MENRLLINLIPGETFLHKLTGKTKVRTFIILLVFIIMSFDMRLILPLFILSIIGLRSLKPNWKTIKYFFIVIGAVNLLNIVLSGWQIRTSVPIGAEEAIRCCSVLPGAST